MKKMNKKLFYLCLIFTILSTKIFSQKILNTDSLNNCEIFTEKTNFDKKERLKQIKELEGKLITVYIIKKNNQIKLKYTGTMCNGLKNEGKEPSKIDVSVINIKVNEESGISRVYFPLTNSKEFRIYLNDCLETKKQ